MFVTAMSGMLKEPAVTAMYACMQDTAFAVTVWLSSMVASLCRCCPPLNSGK